MKKLSLVALILVISFAGCNDDEPVKDDPTPSNGGLTVNLSHTFNTTPFNLTSNFVTDLKDTIKFASFVYYISNVSLQNEAGVWVNFGNYNLVDFSDYTSLKLNLPNLPGGTYKKLRFYVGVDSIANSTGAQEGALNPSNGMFWSWATGYIFIRMQGRFNNNRPMTIDMGGIQNLPIIELPINATINQGTSATANINFNVADVFVTPNDYKLDSVSSIMHDALHPNASMLKQNIESGVFTVTSFQ
jgi:hypothetical protein